MKTLVLALFVLAAAAAVGSTCYSLAGARLRPAISALTAAGR